jgi:hypothetical protein
MSGATALDLRWPIGGLFTALGLILAGYGIATAGNPEHYARAVSVNINLWWGLVMLVFGLTLLLSVRRAGGKRSPGMGTLSPEGRAVEERERRLGLERDTRGS